METNNAVPLEPSQKPPAKVEEPAPVEISELASEEAHSAGKGEPASLLAAGLKIGPPPPYKTPLSAEQLMLLEKIEKVGYEMNLEMKRFVKRRGVFREVLLMGAFKQSVGLSSGMIKLIEGVVRDSNAALQRMERGDSEEAN